MKSVAISNKDREMICRLALAEWRKGVGKTLSEQADALRENINRAGSSEYQRLYPKELREDMHKFMDKYGAGFMREVSFRVYEPVTEQLIRLELGSTELFPIQHEDRNFLEKYHRCSDQLSQWAVQYKEARTDYQSKHYDFESKITDLLNSVSTTGKLLKIWPAAEHLFPERLNQKIRNAENRVNNPRTKPEEQKIDTDDLTAVLVTARMSE